MGKTAFESTSLTNSRKVRVDRHRFDGQRIGESTYLDRALLGTTARVWSLPFLEQTSRVFQAGVRDSRSQYMTNGTIKKLVSDRGFGFIAADDGKEYFFHRDRVENFDSLNGGEKVTFEVEASPQGPRAKLVKLA